MQFKNKAFAHISCKKIAVNNNIDLKPLSLFTILIFLSFIPLFDKKCTLQGYLIEALATSNFKFYEILSY